MSQSHCKYHPRTAARWHCGQCNIDLCSGCVRTENRMGAVFVCPVCEQECESLGMANVITPFWQRLPKFFAYPANPAALAVITVLSLLYAILVGPGMGLVSVLLLFVVVLVTLRYAYAVLQHTALGHLTPPRISITLVMEGLGQPFKQAIVIFVMIFAIGKLVGLLGSWSAIPLIMFAALVLPASTMILAIENRIVNALNPVVLVGMVTRIGAPYLLLWLFLLILTSSSGVIMEILGRVLPAEMALFATMLASNYFTIMMFGMMGYTIYQYHERLGFDVEVDFEDTPEGRGRQGTALATTDPLLAQAHALITEGKINETIELLRGPIETHKASLEVHEYYHKLLKLTRRRDTLIAHAQGGFLATLLAEKRGKRAFEVLRAARALDPGFRPQDPAMVLPLASLANEYGDAPLALDLMNGFARLHKDHPDVVAVYFLAAKVVCEKQRNDAMARKILQDLIAQFPQHSMIAEIKQYLDMVERLAVQRGTAPPVSP